MAKKRGFHPIRFIFKLISILFALVIGFMIFIVFMLYKDSKVPEVTGTYTSYEEIIDNSFESFFTDDDKELFFGTKTEELNSIIVSSLKQTDATSNNLVEQDMFTLKGVWLETKQNEIHIYASASVKLGITFNSQIHIGFALDEVKNIESPVIKLHVKNLDIGKLPLAWSSNLANMILTKFLPDFNLKQMVEEKIPGSTFDLKTRTLLVDIEALINEMFEKNYDTQNLVLLLFDVLYKQSDFISLKITDEILGVQADFKKLEDKTAATSLLYVDQLKTEIEFESFMTYKASDLFLQLLTTNKTIKFNEKELNKVLYYLIKEDPLMDDNVFMKFDVFQNIEAVVSLPYIFVKDDDLMVELALELHDKNNTALNFKTRILINADPFFQGSDLVLKFTKIALGEISLNEDQINLIITMFNDNEMFASGGLVIKDFKDQLSFPDVTIEDINIVNKFFSITIKTDGQVNDVVDKLENNLNDLKTNEHIGTEVTQLVDLLNGGTIDESEIADAINNFLDVFENLDPEIQQELLNQLLDGIDLDGFL